MRTTLFFLALISLISPLPVFAQTAAESIDLSVKPDDVDSYSSRNPFKNYLPEKPKVEVPIDDPNPTPIATELEPTPAEPVAPTLPQLVLTGLVWNSYRPQAIINGQVVDVGGTIGGAKVVLIQKGKVDLTFEGVNITLTP
jgi:hypothetical protein